jgi:two-component system KDP operon response regulator KdpE
VLVLAENGSPEALADMLNAGVDDCLAAPFDPTDLLARVARLLRLGWRRRGMVPIGARGEFRLDLVRPRVRLGGREIRLTRLEYRTLWVLAQGKGAVLSFHDIETRVWGNAGKLRRHALRRVIHNLRRKLGSGLSGNRLLVPERRVGYRLSLS